MAHVNYTYDAPPSIDGPLERTGDEASGLEKRIRIRIQPDLYSWESRNYHSWIGLTWMIEVQDVAEGRRFREGLAAFMVCFGGNQRQQEALLKELAERAEKVRS